MTNITEKQVVGAFRSMSAIPEYQNTYRKYTRQWKLRQMQIMALRKRAMRDAEREELLTGQPAGNAKWRTITSLAEQLNVPEEQIRHVLETNTSTFERAFVGGIPVYRLIIHAPSVVSSSAS